MWKRKSKARVAVSVGGKGLLKQRDEEVCYYKSVKFFKRLRNIITAPPAIRVVLKATIAQIIFVDVLFILNPFVCFDS